MNGQSKDFVTSLQDGMRQNPVAAALVGMGVLWMLTGGSRITAAAALMAPAGRALADGAGTALNAASSAVATTRDLSARAVDQAQDAAASAAESASGAATKVFEAVKPKSSLLQRAPSTSSETETALSPVIASLKETFERQPLLLGAIGVAIGTAFAAALPVSKIENDLAGETAQRLTAQAKDLAAENAENVKAAASRAFEAVKDEAAAQGLTVEGVKSGASVLGQKIAAVAGATKPTKPVAD